MKDKTRPTLTTQRLTLRPFELSDAPQVKQLAGDRIIADTTLNIPHPYEEGMAEEWISTHQPKCESGELYNCAITLKDSGTLIGAVGLSINQRFKRGELGYWIAKNHWGKGYCTEACDMFLNFAFNELKLNKVTATYIPRNPASGRVMEKLGMKKEGYFKEHVTKWGKFEDIISYGILRAEYFTS